MSTPTIVSRRAVAVALVIGAAWAGLRGIGSEPFPSSPELTANRCILCKSYGASQMPRVCSTCNNKFNNRCVLCNAYGANQAPRICSTCNNKFNNRCILCNAYGANHTPRICTTCNNKF